MIEKVRAAMERLEASGKHPSVRAVRDAIGGGSLTDVGNAIRQVKQERDRLKAVHSELPQTLKDKVSLLALDLWSEAQERASRAIEDVRLGCELRAVAAEDQARDVLRDIDEAERRITELVADLERARRHHADLEASEKAASNRAAAAEARAAALGAEIKRMTHLLVGAKKPKGAAKPAVNDKTAANPKPAEATA
ncbi:DNA-binding protein [Bradyrhizobium sp. WYCCWR 13022]|uniref:DNA-binding protein n=1 Tax=unclassified Bradyrhizobium TaxID=2631580 RepID=UPI00263BB4BD|nr:DNA-binding protein [Bradyrhizobium sp. WYCCWR 13022]MDN4987174.1 DNA-binding protein [Bradyrhizobium sp. WYCCWR 13022]